MSIDRLLDLYLLISFLFVLVMFPPYLFWQRRTRGQILYRLPRSRLYRGFLGFVVLASTIGILVQIISMPNDSGLSTLKLWASLLPLTFGLYSLFPANRFEIREAGVYSHGRFIKWKALNAFQWKEEGNFRLGLGAEAYILGLNVQGDRYPQWLERYKFQRDQRERVDRLLFQYLPKAA